MLNGEGISTETLHLMCDAMRAPADRPAHARARVTVWQEGPVGLAVLDSDGHPDSLSKGHSGYVLAGDVRLDERAALQHELRVATLSNAEQDESNPAKANAALTVGAIERWGEEAPLKLLGDFALAGWNPQSRELMLVRDPLGIRPIVYAWQPGKFLAFASFPIGVHASGMVPRELDTTALIHAFFMQRQPGETYSAGVKELIPGHTLRVRWSGSDSVIRLRRYWRPELGKYRHKSPAEAAAELRQLIISAVESRVESTEKGSVAAHLSGGLDSSALAVIASRKLVSEGRKLLGYSFLMEPQEGVLHDDESPYVEAVLAQEPQIDWMPIWPPDPIGYLYQHTDIDWGLSLWDRDPENRVCADASAKGANLILSGWGGDEGATFNGRGALGDAFLRGRWGYCLREIEAAKHLRGFSRRSTLRSEIFGQVTPLWLTRMLGLRGDIRELAASCMAMLAKDSVSAAQDLPWTWTEITPNVRQNQLNLLRSHHLAVRATNWASIGARYGQAFTFPLLDRRVVEFVLSLPAEWHMREARKRRVFRDAMENILPEKIRWRFDKMSPFPTAVGTLLKESPAILKSANQLAKVPLVLKIFNIEAACAAIVSARKSGEEDSSLFLSATRALDMARYIEEHFAK